MGSVIGGPNDPQRTIRESIDYAIQHVITPALIKASLGIQGRLARVIDSNVTVKLGRVVTKKQYDLLQRIYDTGTIPCPKPLDFVTLTPECNAIFMSTIPGKVCDVAFLRLDKEQQSAVARDVVRGLTALNEALAFDPASKAGMIGSAIDDSCMVFPHLHQFTEARIPITEFVNTMKKLSPQKEEFAADQKRILDTLVQDVIDGPSTQPLSFCHMDVQPFNVLIHEGKLSGVIDWDWAGWYTMNMEAYVMCDQCDIHRDFRNAMMEAWNRPVEPMYSRASRFRLDLYRAHQEEFTRLSRLERLAVPKEERTRRRRLHRARREAASKEVSASTPISAEDATVSEEGQEAESRVQV